MQLSVPSQLWKLPAVTGRAGDDVLLKVRPYQRVGESGAQSGEQSAMMPDRYPAVEGDMKS